MGYAFNHPTTRINLGTAPLWGRMVEAHCLGYTDTDQMLTTLAEAEAYVGAVP